MTPPDPYDEEKGEARTGSSATTPGSATTPPGEGPHEPPMMEAQEYFGALGEGFLQALLEGR